MGRAGIEPATNKGHFYRALPTPIGEPTQNLPLHLVAVAGESTRINQGMNLGLCINRYTATPEAEVRIELTIFAFAERRLQPLSYSAI